MKFNTKIIDFHTHAGSKTGDIPLDLEGLKKIMVKTGVTMSVVFPSGKELIDDSISNSYTNVLGIIPFMRFDPKEILPEVFDRMVNKYIGIKGFKFHPRQQNFDPLDKDYEQIFKIIEKSGKPVVIHSRKENNPNTDPDRIIDICAMYPNTNFVFGHFANDSNVFFDKMLSYKNAFVETSIVSSPKIIEFRVNKYGSERILFGSDTPYSDQQIELMKIKRMQVSKKHKDNILFKNAERLLGI